MHSDVLLHITCHSLFLRVGFDKSDDKGILGTRGKHGKKSLCVGCKRSLALQTQLTGLVKRKPVVFFGSQKQQVSLIISSRRLPLAKVFKLLELFPHFVTLLSQTGIFFIEMLCERTS